MMKLGKKCTGCSACYSVCAKKAIIMSADDQGFLHPLIDKSKCVNCKICEQVCPLIDNNSDKLMNAPSQEAYAVKSKKKEIQLSSTSGGFFSALARTVVEAGGIIYGVSFDDEWRVRHIRVSDISELYHLAESKYVQSIIGDSYNQAKTDLIAGKTVLFSGTSCQIAGLKSFLKKDYPNLILVDVVCHGVPAPRVWNWYIDKQQSEYNSNAVLVKHKGKDEGGWSWQNQFLRIDFESGEKLREGIWANAYMSGFLSDIYLRDSCYKCAFKNSDVKRVADLTIADFWGCENEEPEFFDGNGVSLVLANNEKGRNVLLQLENCVTKKTKIREALKYNGAVYASYYKPKSSKVFWKRFNENMELEQFDNLVYKCSANAAFEKKSFIFKVKRKIKRICSSRRNEN